MRRKLVMGNWKMHGSVERVESLLTDIKLAEQQGGFADTAICPPYIYISQAISALKGSGIAVGAQNVNECQEGAFTGEVSAPMLADLACRYVLVGHSERRSLFGESDECVASKFVAAQAAGLIPVLCLGESLEQRQAGETLEFVAGQLKAVVAAAGVGALVNAVVAYEPIWAIGTGMTASPEEAQEVHAYLRQLVAAGSVEVAEKLQILYGGSVNAANAVELFAKDDIDGALVGGASLKAEDFSVICRAASA